MLKEISFNADFVKKRHPPQKKETEPSHGTQKNKKTSYAYAYVRLFFFQTGIGGFGGRKKRTKKSPKIFEVDF